MLLARLGVAAVKRIGHLYEWSCGWRDPLAANALVCWWRVGRSDRRNLTRTRRTPNLMLCKSMNGEICRPTSCHLLIYVTSRVRCHGLLLLLLSQELQEKSKRRGEVCHGRAWSLDVLLFSPMQGETVHIETGENKILMSSFLVGHQKTLSRPRTSPYSGCLDGGTRHIPSKPCLIGEIMSFYSICYEFSAATEIAPFYASHPPAHNASKAMPFVSVIMIFILLRLPVFLPHLSPSHRP